MIDDEDLDERFDNVHKRIDDTENDVCSLRDEIDSLRKELRRTKKYAMIKIHRLEDELEKRRDGTVGG